MRPGARAQLPRAVQHPYIPVGQLLGARWCWTGPRNSSVSIIATRPERRPYLAVGHCVNADEDSGEIADGDMTRRFSIFLAPSPAPCLETPPRQCGGCLGRDDVPFTRDHGGFRVDEVLDEVVAVEWNSHSWGGRRAGAQTGRFLLFPLILCAKPPFRFVFSLWPVTPRKLRLRAPLHRRRIRLLSGVGPASRPRTPLGPWPVRGLRPGPRRRRSAASGFSPICT